MTQRLGPVPAAGLAAAVLFLCCFAEFGVRADSKSIHFTILAKYTTEIGLLYIWQHICHFVMS